MIPWFDRVGTPLAPPETDALQAQAIQVHKRFFQRFLGSRRCDAFISEATGLYQYVIAQCQRTFHQHQTHIALFAEMKPVEGEPGFFESSPFCRVPIDLAMAKTSWTARANQDNNVWCPDGPQESHHVIDGVRCRRRHRSGSRSLRRCPG